eukprot:gene7574-9310_t
MDIKKRVSSSFCDDSNPNGMSYMNHGSSDYKRIKIEGDGSSDKTSSINEPSPVVHCRGLPYTMTENDLINMLSPFGKVESVCLMKKGQALIEMDSVQSSSAIISHSNTKSFYLNGQKIIFAYSISQRLNNSKKTPGGVTPHNYILLCSILNPIFPITTNVLYTIMSPFGRVLRIVIFQKNGLQAFIEFDSSYSAWSAKEALNGHDIYTGSCRLQIDFARSVGKLNVKQNDSKTADYTIGDPAFQPVPPPPYLYMPPQTQETVPPGTTEKIGYPPAPPPGYMYPVEPMTQTVVMVHKLPESLDADKLFNIFCLYGNVLKIKMLHNTKGGAMVQMADGVQAETAIQCLNQTNIYGQKILVFHSKHQYIADSEKTKDFSESPYNRFSRLPAGTYGKNIYKPSTTLYFLNSPTPLTEPEFLTIFQNFGTHTPVHIKFFPPIPGSTKQMGLVEFADTKSATEALMEVNNAKLENGNLVKLSFTINSINHKADQ